MDVLISVKDVFTLINIGGATVIPKDGFTIDRNKLEERDSGQLSTFNNRAERYEPYDLVTIEGIDEQFVVQADNVIRLRDELYEHDVSLIEAIATFDGFYPADRIFSADPPKTLGQVLNVYKKELAKYHNLSIAWDTQADWTNTPIRQKEFVGVNFGVIVADLFRTLDAKPRAKFENGVWKIFPDFYNERRNLITPNPVSDLLSQDNLDYATKIKTQIKNGVYESQQERSFPSENGFVLPKTEGPQIFQSKLRYELDSSIIDITEVKVFDVNIRGDFAEQPINKTFDEIDITKHVVPKQFWDGLRSPVNQKEEGRHKKNTLFFNIGSRFIENLFNSETEGILIWKDNVAPLQNAIVAALYEQNAPFPQLSGGMQDEPITEFTATNQPPSIFPNVPVFKEEIVKMRIKYIPQRSFDVVHHRQYLKDMNQFTQIHKQRDSQTEVERYKNVLKNLSNRMGNDIRQLSQVFTDTPPFDLADYDINDNVIVRVKNTFYNDYTLCEFIMAEGFGNIDGESALFKEPSPFEILGKDITTNLIIEEYVSVSRESKNVNTRLKPNAVKSVLSTLDNSITSLPPVRAAVMTPRVLPLTLVSTNGVYLPAFTGGGGNTTSFHFQIDDPISAGRAFSDTFEDPELGLDLIYTEPDTSTRFGELDEFLITLIPDVDIEDDGFYPLLPSGFQLENVALTETDIIETIDKDKNAKFAVTFQQHFVTDERDIIIGSGLAKYNRLFTDTAIPQLKIYRSAIPYSIYDNKIRANDVLTTGSVSIDENTRKLSVEAVLPFGQPELKYVAIAFDNEIALAFNDFGVNEEYFINFEFVAGKQIETFSLLANPTAAPKLTFFIVGGLNLSSSTLSTASLTLTANEPNLLSAISIANTTLDFTAEVTPATVINLSSETLSTAALNFTAEVTPATVINLSASSIGNANIDIFANPALTLTANSTANAIIDITANPVLSLVATANAVGQLNIQ